MSLWSSTPAFIKAVQNHVSCDEGAARALLKDLESLATSASPVLSTDSQEASEPVPSPVAILSRIKSAISRHGSSPEHLFRSLDSKGYGFLSRSDLTRMICSFDPQCKGQRLEALVSKFDSGRKRRVDLAVFSSVLDKACPETSSTHQAFSPKPRKGTQATAVNRMGQKPWMAPWDVAERLAANHRAPGRRLALRMPSRNVQRNSLHSSRDPEPVEAEEHQAQEAVPQTGLRTTPLDDASQAILHEFLDRHVVPVEPIEEDTESSVPESKDSSRREWLPQPDKQQADSHRTKNIQLDDASNALLLEFLRRHGVSEEQAAEDTESSCLESHSTAARAAADQPNEYADDSFESSSGKEESSSYEDESADTPDGSEEKASEAEKTSGEEKASEGKKATDKDIHLNKSSQKATDKDEKQTIADESKRKVGAEKPESDAEDAYGSEDSFESRSCSSSSPGSSAGEQLQVPRQVQMRAKHVFFDFDQTISRCHVFKQLAGWEGPRQCVPPPFATTERGQINRITELNGIGSWCYDQSLHLVVKSDGAACGEPWSRAALGGITRVRQLHQLFSDLRSNGVTLTVITKGFIGVVRMMLAEENMLDFFSEVYGNIGPAMYGFTPYDRTLPVPSKFEGTEEYSMMHWHAKVNIIQYIMHKDGADTSEAMLVEDDPHEIAAVRGTCLSVFVQQQRGIMPYEMEAIFSLAKSGQPAPPPAPPPPPPPPPPAPAPPPPK